MPRLSMNAITTYRWSFEEDLLNACEAGYDGVGVWLRKVFDFGEERAVELIAESGLAVTNASWIGGFTGADAATTRENLAHSRDAIDLSAELGAGSLTVYTGGRNNHTSRHADRLLRGALDQLIPHAERMGVPLALEPMHPACAADWTVLTGLQQTLRLVRDYDTPSLCIALDSYHFPLSEADTPLLRELAPHLAVVHLGDFVEPQDHDLARVPLGEGDAPLGGLVRGLLEAGYAGDFDVKLLGPEIESSDYHRLLEQSYAAVTEMTEPALSEPNPRPSDACNATW